MNKKANLSLVILSVVALFAIGGLAIMYNGGATGAAASAGSLSVLMRTQALSPDLSVHGNVNSFNIRAAVGGDMLSSQIAIGDDTVLYETSVQTKRASMTRDEGIVYIGVAPANVRFDMQVLVNGVPQTDLSGINVQVFGGDPFRDQRGYVATDIFVAVFNAGTQTWQVFAPADPNGKFVPGIQFVPVNPNDVVEIATFAEIV